MTSFSRGLRMIALTGLSILACANAFAQSDDAASQDQDIASQGNPGNGGELFSRYCRGCHGEGGRGDGMVFMPKVPNLTKKGYIDQLPDSYLLLAISKGGPGIGKSNYMPAF
ncbi:MAG: cytochrome c, partial [Burkholderiales bacterium]|nr:cytochrome c [Burkholderiales bacterium]